MTKLTRDDMMEAVSEGIRRGIWDVATNIDAATRGAAMIVRVAIEMT